MKDFGNDICFVKEERLFRLRAAAVIVHDGHVLMSRNEQDAWHYSVGGAVEFGESVEDAVKREVFEECGVELDIDRLLVVHQNYFRGDEGCDWHELAFYYLMDTSKITNWESFVQRRSLTMNDVPERTEWVSISGYSNQLAYPAFFEDLNTILTQSEPILITTRDS